MIRLVLHWFGLEESVCQFHCGTARLVLINGSHGPGLVSPCWLTTHQPAHPKTAFDSGMFGNVAVYAVQKLGFPTLMTQQHVCKSCFASVVELSERLPCWLWCDSHRTFIWTTPILVDKQMIREAVCPYFTWSLALSPADVSLRLDDVGHTAGG